MKLESQVTSLELSKRLKELGVKQESLFYWTDGRISLNSKLLNNTILVHNGRPETRWLGGLNKQNPDLPVENYYSAFTASELLELLPQYISINLENPPLLYLKKDFVNWEIQYHNSAFHHIPSKPITDSNFINALAKMLIHLIENKLMEIK